jgi:hypothetical protein
MPDVGRRRGTLRVAAGMGLGVSIRGASAVIVAGEVDHGVRMIVYAVEGPEGLPRMRRGR